MSAPSSDRSSTCVKRKISASRQAIFAAFVDAEAVATWLPPRSMTGAVHRFEPRPGGEFRLSLTYQSPDDRPPGKTSADTDTVQGRFAELIPDERMVWVVAFESDDPTYGGEMRLTFQLADVPGGTEVSVLTEGIPPGVRPEDNEAGCRSTLENLTAYVERPA